MALYNRMALTHVRTRVRDPLVHDSVAVEPALPSDAAALEEGLRMLNRADPFVEISVQDNGEAVVCAAGERMWGCACFHARACTCGCACVGGV